MGSAKRLSPNPTYVTTFLIGLAYVAFVSLGLPDGLLGVAWPSIHKEFAVKVGDVGALLLTFTAGYLGAGFASGQILARINVGTLLAASCLATGISLIGYSASPRWEVMIAFGLLAGIGAGAIDAGLNTYAAKHFNTRVLNWMHACYGLGAFTGPMLMTAVMTSGRSWRLAYGIVALCQLVLAACFGATRSRWEEAGERTDERSTATASYAATLRHPATWMGIALFFLYTGVEAGAGIWVYSLFTEARSVPEGTARMCVSIYWGSLAAGRILSGTAAAWLSAQTLLRVSMIGLIVGAALIWFRPGDLMTFAGLAGMGLSAAPIFPTLISVTPALVGTSHTANVVGFQIGFAVLGASLLPSCIGYLVNSFGLEAVGPSLFAASVALYGLWEASHHRRW